MSMSEYEKKQIKEVAEAYNEEEIKLVLSTVPSSLLFEELQERDKRNREIIDRVAESISR